MNRKILYGYQVQNGETAIHPVEAITAARVFTIYEAGLSYQQIADTLNGEKVPFSQEAPLWNKHKVKRLLENPRYTGRDGYPALVSQDIFDRVQGLIREKTSGYTARKERPASKLRLLCESCGGCFHRLAGPNRRTDTLYLKCGGCGALVTITDAALLNEAARQIAEHNAPCTADYAPSEAAIRLTNAVNRGLEHPDKPEDVVSLILQGISARYGCCPETLNIDPNDRPGDVDLDHIAQAVSHITISAENTVTVYFKQE